MEIREARALSSTPEEHFFCRQIASTYRKLRSIARCKPPLVVLQRVAASLASCWLLNTPRWNLKALPRQAIPIVNATQKGFNNYAHLCLGVALQNVSMTC